MQKILKLSFTFAVLLFAASCSNSKKDGDASINDKKVQLEKLKTSKEKQDEQIRKLQEELAKIDTSSTIKITSTPGLKGLSRQNQIKKMEDYVFMIKGN